MIEWKPYDKYDRGIESHVYHLITDGLSVMVAQHAKYVNSDGYGWHDGSEPLNLPVTHWANINLPKNTTKNSESHREWSSYNFISGLPK